MLPNRSILATKSVSNISRRAMRGVLRCVTLPGAIGNRNGPSACANGPPPRAPHIIGGVVGSCFVALSANQPTERQLIANSDEEAPQ